MDRLQNEFKLNDLLIFFPIYYSDFIHYIFSFVDINIPKVCIGILLILRKFGPMSISNIGDKLSIAKPNMTNLIDELTDREWVKRSHSSLDRRVINIEITDKGIEALEEITANLNTILNEKFSVLSQEEIYKMVEAVDFLVSVSRRVCQRDGSLDTSPSHAKECGYFLSGVSKEVIL